MVEGGHPRRLWTAAGAMLLVSAAYYGAHSVLTRAAYEAGGDVGFGSPVFQSIRFMWLLALLIVPVAGLVADKWLGIRRMLLLGSATVAVGIVLCIVKQVPFLMAGGAVLALGMGCFRYPLYVYLGEAYPKLAPTRLAGFVVLFIAGELGPMAVNLVSGIIISSFGTAFGFVFVALPAIAAFVLLLAVPEPPAAEASGPTLPSVFGPELVALAILAGVALCLDIAFAGALAGAHPRVGSSSLSTATMLTLVYSVGPVVVLIAGVIAAVFWSGGTLSSYSEHVGTSLAIGGALIAVSVVLSTVFPNGEEGIGMGAAMGTHALTALGELAIYPMLMAAVTALAPQPWRASAVGVFALTGIGNFLPNLFPS
ncbi:MAG: MFS transporter, partial [Myxococcaceae bacterium]